MTKTLKRLLPLILLLAAAFALSQTASAAPDLISAPGTAARYKTTLTDGSTAVITNNYMASDVIEVTLPADTVAPAKLVYWVYKPGATDKSASLGSVVVKKGSSSGKLSISNTKLGDFESGHVNIVMNGELDECEYGPAGTTLAIPDDVVTLRNSASGMEVLIVDSSVVTKGMVATALVNGKTHRATAKADGAELQVNLPSNMEVGTPVWYTVAAAGCQDVGYKKLILGEVKVSVMPAGASIKSFFQGDGASYSSIIVMGLKPGNVIRCYNEDNVLKKSGTVASNGSLIIINGLRLNGGDKLLVTITEKGNLESAPTEVIMATEAVPPSIKASSITKLHSKTDGATITVKGVTEGYNVNIYNSHGAQLTGSIQAVDTSGTGKGKGDVVFEGLDLGTLNSTVVYLSVTSGGIESAWLKVSVPAAK